MEGSGVAVERATAGGFEGAVEFEQPVGNHSDIGHHIVLTKETAERLHHLGNGSVGSVHQFIKFARGQFTPVPRVFKRRDPKAL